MGISLSINQQSEASSSRKSKRVLRKLIREKRFLAIALMWICTHLLRLISYTYRYKILNEKEFLEATSGQDSVIYAFWHQNILSTMLSKRKDLKVVCLISGSRDGDLIAYPCESLGMKVLRGSSGKMAVSVKKDFERCLLDGYSGVIAIDGPVGPAYKVKYGSISFSSNTGLPVVPYRAFASKYFSLSTWDKMKIPIPFSTINAIYGDPIYVEENVDKSQYAQYADRIERSLLKLETLTSKDFSGVASITKFGL